MKYKKSKKKIKPTLEGSGLYVYENNTDADLSLPKPSNEGFILIKPRQRFTGDSYFLSFIKPPDVLLRLIENVSDNEVSVALDESKPKIEDKELKKNKSKTINKKTKKKKTKKGVKVKEKLILDQPDVVTQNGKVENIVEVEDIKENENENEMEEKLLTENPSGNIEIISD